MIGRGDYCGSCKYYEQPPNLIMGFCSYWKEEAAIFGRCKEYAPKIIQENKVKSMLSCEHCSQKIDWSDLNGD